MRLFRCGWRVIGLSGLFRSPWIPLGIGVENRVLEIVGLDSRLGLILGDFYLGTGKPVQALLQDYPRTAESLE